MFDQVLIPEETFLLGTFHIFQIELVTIDVNEAISFAAPLVGTDQIDG